MNGDLKLRLKSYQKLNATERDFWKMLCNELGMRALFYSGIIKGDCQISYRFEPIENGEDDSAYMIGDDNFTEFEVVIDDRMPLGMMIDFLIHELAHVQSWIPSSHNGEKDHGPEFGIAYADLYDCYLELYDKFWSENE